MFTPVLSKAYQNHFKGWDFVKSQKISDLPVYYVCVYRSYELGTTSGRIVTVPVFRSVVVKCPRYSTKENQVTPAVYMSPTCGTVSRAIYLAKHNCL